MWFYFFFLFFVFFFWILVGRVLSVLGNSWVPDAGKGCAALFCERRYWTTPFTGRKSSRRRLTVYTTCCLLSRVVCALLLTFACLINDYFQLFYYIRYTNLTILVHYFWINYHKFYIWSCKMVYYFITGNCFLLLFSNKTEAFGK